MFRPNQKVVCVDAQPQTVSEGTPLVKGAIYTVIQGDSIIGLWLAEVAPPPHYINFNARRFRPVVERKTSIEIFQKMLTPSEIDRVAADEIGVG